ncbi:hypothetical protein [Bacteroides fragilis]|jgi:hypothetical protein|uniref:hypothetical protein n=2 Tax=Bacteroides fragilis TaxID=817 RepID=UPI002030510E|nr:hypothetical protein [Bacteroides fragilis]MCM0193985.1 hypothetical protein [Bacteroides fragilis]MCM0216509.1 hypothetical protein [Bacteroides fragilis]MCM0286284.1 hypothetical protein [Bacteroides fragilis]DAO85716.1 MAG TPA: hypothetical protein [Caudoviricetes sp.]
MFRNLLKKAEKNIMEIFNEHTQQWEEVTSLKVRSNSLELSVKEERGGISINKTSWSKTDDGSMIIVPTSNNKIIVK